MENQKYRGDEPAGNTSDIERHQYADSFDRLHRVGHRQEHDYRHRRRESGDRAEYNADGRAYQNEEYYERAA